MSAKIGIVQELQGTLEDRAIYYAAVPAHPEPEPEPERQKEKLIEEGKMLITIISIASPVLVSMLIYLHRLGGRLAVAEIHILNLLQDLEDFAYREKRH